MKPKRTGTMGAALALLGVALVVFTQWMAFFWAPTEALQGPIQRIYYIHIPAAWLCELAFVVCAFASAIYLWLGEERADAAAVVAAEGGLWLGVLLLVVGPLWGRVAWGTWWTWEPRLTLTLLLWFIYFGYFLVRGAATNPERGKRLAAVVAIVGALDIPLIHMSVYWFRSLHPEPVVLRPEGPTADPEIVVTLLASLGAWTVLFLGLCMVRYGVELAERALLHRPSPSREAA